MSEYLGVRFFGGDLGKLKQRFEEILSSSKQAQIVTANAEMLVASRNDPALRSIIQQADIVTADGFGPVLLGMAGNRTRITGIQITNLLAGICSMNKQRMVLIGGVGDVSSRAASTLRSRFPSLDVISLRIGDVRHANGQWHLDTNLVQLLHDLCPSVLLVALGHGKQEKWINDFLPRLASVRIAVGVGGVFDVLAGDLPASPRFLQTVGLESLWRLILQPRRFGRVFRAIFLFPILVFWDRMRPLWKS